MRTAAAKGKSSWRLLAASLATLVAAGATEASRFTPSAANNLLEKQGTSSLAAAQHAGDLAPAFASASAFRFPILTAADRAALTAPLAEQLASELEAAIAGIGGAKLASGGQTSELRHNLWRLHELTTISHPSRFSYARARWYDARNASWLSEDPAQDVDSPNLYAYVAWQPHMATDPMGLSFKTWLKGTAEGAVNLALGLAQAGQRALNPAAAVNPLQESVNFTDPSQPTVVTSLRDPGEELKAATVVYPVGEMLGRFGGNAYLTAEGWFDSDAPQGYLDEIHADLGRDTPGVALALAPLPKVIRAGRARAAAGAAETEAATSPGGGLSSRGYRPALGERALTREQWAAEYRANRIASGPTSSWSGARADYFTAIGESELTNPSGAFSQTNIARMLEGKAPQVRAEVFVHRTGLVVQRDISLELHHRFFTQRSGSALAHESWNLEMTMPWGHAAMDPWRFLGYDLLKIIRGPGTF